MSTISCPSECRKTGHHLPDLAISWSMERSNHRKHRRPLKLNETSALAASHRDDASFENFPRFVNGRGLARGGQTWHPLVLSVSAACDFADSWAFD